MPEAAPVAAAPTNARVAELFDDIADLLEIEQQNPFRIRAYRNAARELRTRGQDIAAMVARGEDLDELPGIGADLAGKICEIVNTGRCSMLDELHRTWPASLHEVLRVPGVGPRKARALFEHLGVKTLADLRAAAEAHTIREVPGFGAQSERNILDALAGLMGTGRRMSLADARPQAARIVARLRAADGVLDCVVAGSYRRARPTVGDLDILVTAKARNQAIATLVHGPDVGHVLAEGPTRATVVLRSGLQVDLRVVDRSSFGAALHYFTGSKAHNIAVRRLGVARGLKINEYGVFRGERRVAGRTEASVFAAVDLPFIPPELRENRGEIAAARARDLPTLVDVTDLRGDLVLVPATGDVDAIVASAAAAARARKLAYLVAVHLVRHRGPAVDWAKRLQTGARAAAEHDLALVQGLEVDLLRGTAPDVAVDFTAARADLTRAPQRPALVRALARVRPSLLRVVLDAAEETEEALAPDWLMRAAAPAVLAVDGDPVHLPRLESLFRAAHEAGLELLVGSGGEPGGGAASRLELAVSQARRAWLGAADIVNTRPLADLRVALAREARRQAS